jgi:rhodanese-related sulfurtransferase
MSGKHKVRHSVASGSTRYHRSKKHGVNLKWLWVGLGVLLVAGVLILILGLTNASGSEITVAQAYEKYQQGALFLDVRTQDEWTGGHIAGSMLIPLDELHSRLSELPMDQQIVVVCRSGARSREGLNILQKAGFKMVTCMRWGILAWSAAGYPLDAGTP